MATVRDQESSIFHVLIRQHRTVDSLIDQIGALCTENVREAADLFEVMTTQLLAHAKAEEVVVYPRFAAFADMTHAQEEHAEIEAALDRLDALEYDDEEFLAALLDLQAKVQAHVLEEEGVLFAKARTEITGAEADAMAMQFLEEFAALSEEPAPSPQPAPPPAPTRKRGLIARLLGRH